MYRKRELTGWVAISAFLLVPLCSERVMAQEAKITFELYYLSKRNMLEAFAPDPNNPGQNLYNEPADILVRERILALVKNGQKFTVTVTFTDSSGNRESPFVISLNPQDLVDQREGKFRIVAPIRVDFEAEVDFNVDAPGFIGASLKGLYPGDQTLKIVMPVDKKRSSVGTVPGCNLPTPPVAATEGWAMPRSCRPLLRRLFPGW